MSWHSPSWDYNWDKSMQRNTKGQLDNGQAHSFFSINRKKMNIYWDY